MTIAEWRDVCCPSCGGDGYHDDPDLGPNSCGCNDGTIQVLMEHCQHCDGEGEIEVTTGGNGFAEADVWVECPHCDGTGWVEVE